jgi:hypothetical protein
MERSWMQRMTFVLVPEAETDDEVVDSIEAALQDLSHLRAIGDWKILMVQVTAVQIP